LDLLPGQVRSKSNGSSVAAARDDMDESDLMVVSFIENPEAKHPVWDGANSYRRVHENR
jgi:hypothetical protein